jgi:hypothetical protein
MASFFGLNGVFYGTTLFSIWFKDEQWLNFRVFKFSGNNEDEVEVWGPNYNLSLSKTTISFFFFFFFEENNIILHDVPCLLFNNLMSPNFVCINALIELMWCSYSCYPFWISDQYMSMSQNSLLNLFKCIPIFTP